MRAAKRKRADGDRYVLRGDDEHGWEVFDVDGNVPVTAAQAKYAAQFRAEQLNGRLPTLDD